MLQQHLSPTRNTWSGEIHENTAVSVLRKQQILLFPSNLPCAGGIAAQMCAHSWCEDVCALLSGHRAQGRGQVPLCHHGAARPWMSPPQPLCRGTRALTKGTAGDTSANEPKTLTEGSSSNSPTHFAVLLLSSISIYEQIHIQKYCQKGYKFNNNQSIFSIFFSYISKMEKNLHITVSLLNFHSQKCC